VNILEREIRLAAGILEDTHFGNLAREQARLGLCILWSRTNQHDESRRWIEFTHNVFADDDSSSRRPLDNRSHALFARGGWC
jgi:hypothetical protein